MNYLGYKLTLCALLGFSSPVWAVEKKSSDEEVVQLPEVLVMAQSQENASVHNPTVNLAGLIKAEKQELPMNIETLNSTLLDERYTTSLYETLEYTAGIFTGGATPFSRTAGQVSMRGFSGSDMLLNGLVMPGSFSYYLDAVAIDRVDIFRGPLNGVTGGQTSSLGPYGVGGNINTVTKSASTDREFHRLTMGNVFNDHYRARTTYDGNYVLDEGLALRLPVAYENGRPDYLSSDLRENQKLSLAPSLYWQLGADTSFELKTYYSRGNAASYQGIPYMSGKFLVDRDTYYGNDDTRDIYELWSVQPTLTHQFNKSLSLSLGGGFASMDLEREAWYVSSFDRDPNYYPNLGTTGQGKFAWHRSESRNENTNLFAHLNYQLQTGAVHHDLIAGVDWLKKTSYSRYPVASIKTGLEDLENPTLELPPGAREETEKDYSETQRTGFLLQDFMRFGKWRVMAGARFDRHQSDEGNKANAISPRLGLTYLLTEETALYANYSHNEAPCYGYDDPDGHELTDSWKADAYELGVKQRLGDNLWLNTNVFEIRQMNTPTPDDPSNPNGGYTYGAKNQSRGIELNLSGEFTDNWRFQASYTTIKYKDLTNEVSFAKQPEHSASFWTSYRFGDGPLQDLRLGGGYRYRSKSYVTFRGGYLGDEYYVADSHVVDVNAEYPLARIVNGLNGRLQVGIKNLFDEVYVESNRNAAEFFPGAGRTVYANLSFDF